MDRVTVYAGEQPTEEHVLQGQKNAMVGLGRLAWATVGGALSFHGFTLSATGPASMSLNAAAGSSYSQMPTDATAYSSLPADSTTLVKQGIYTGGTLAFPAPGTAGQSINYLVQAAIADADTGAVVLPYYNAANPSIAYAGPGNSGTSQSTSRGTKVTLTVKAGTAAATGTQTTPAPDAGNTGLWVVTVANGAVTVTAANVSAYPGTQFLTHSVPVLQELIKAVIVDAGITVNPADPAQLLQAIRNMGFSTGDGKLTLKAAADPGWVLANDGTIGDAASAATTRANADTAALYAVLWAIPDAYAPVTGGRGASAAADFAAHKPIALTKQLGRAIAVAGTGAGLTARALGSVFGSETVALTGPQTGPHDHLVFADEDQTGSTVTATGHAAREKGDSGDSGYRITNSSLTPTLGLTAVSGAGDPHPNVPPTTFWNVMIKL